MTTSHDLHKLQAQDLEIGQLHRRLAELQEASALAPHRERVEAGEAALESLRQELVSLKKRVRELERDTQEHAARGKELHGKLYGGYITSPREMESCELELEQARSKKEQTEEEALEAMMALEELEEQLSAQERSVAELRTELEGERRKAAEEKPELESQLESASQKRDQMVARIDAEALRLYERLRKELGTAVAEVVGVRCSGCRMGLPTGALQGLHNMDLTRCTNCNRILHRVDEQL
ncbi:MAG: hypothetical protein HY319_32670 [Armatimonadetes bacterium]|nr:hypothetical protein [Armatimonadota bacterium]